MSDDLWVITDVERSVLGWVQLPQQLEVQEVGWNKQNLWKGVDVQKEQENGGRKCSARWKNIITEGSRDELSSAENSRKMRIQDGSFWGEILIFFIYICDIYMWYIYIYNIYPNNLIIFTQIILEQSLVGRAWRENKREENGTLIVTYLIVLRQRDGAL